MCKAWLEFNPVHSKLQVKMSEKLCVQWNNFHDNIRDAFQNLKDDQDFADVTLVSGDGQKLDAHRVILAAASPLFQEGKIIL